MLVDAVISFLVNLASSYTYDELKGEAPKREEKNIFEADKEEAEKNPVVSFPVNSLYAYFGKHPNDKFIPLVKSMVEPNIYIFIETEPSTFYNLGAVIIEENRTNDWFGFYKGVAFQGSGGGWKNTQRLYATIKELGDLDKNIAMSLRVAKNQDMELLKQGRLYWSEFKNRTVPAMVCKDELLNSLQQRFMDEVVNGKSES